MTSDILVPFLAAIVGGALVVAAVVADVLLQRRVRSWAFF